MRWLSTNEENLYINFFLRSFSAKGPQHETLITILQTPSIEIEVEKFK